MSNHNYFQILTSRLTQKIYPPSVRTLSAIIATISIIFMSIGFVRSQTPSNSCSNSALTRFLKHTTAPGETVTQIAQKYQLLPSTLQAMNPNLGNGKISSGREILIPPYDGIVVEVRKGETWRDIAKNYNVRADVLFELNGCQQPQEIAFIPTAKMTSNRDRTRFTTPVATNSTPTRFSAYPLSATTPFNIVLGYGWQKNPRDGEVFFHSGIDLLANVGTPVQSVADGVVAYAQEQGSYGKLVIINHSSGLQTRYAHLEAITVTLGQKIASGSEIGKVGISGKPASKQPHLHFEVRVNSDLGWAAKEPKEYFLK